MEKPLNNIKEDDMKSIKVVVMVAASAGIVMSAMANTSTPTAPQNNPCQAQLAQCKEKNHAYAARCEKVAQSCNAKLAKQERHVQAQQKQEPQQQSR